jgi:hydrogenase maturation protease
MAERRSDILVIGIGNPDRGDDAAGRAAASRLKARLPKDIRVIESDGDAAALLAQLADADDVILIDAALSGAGPGTIARFAAHETPLPAARFGLSTHGFGLAEAIELARTLGQMPRRCTVYAIEGRSFALGEGLSPEIDAAVDTVVARILDTISERIG